MDQQTMCPHCATVNEIEEDGATYCEECGRWLAFRDKSLKERLDKFWTAK